MNTEERRVDLRERLQRKRSTMHATISMAAVGMKPGERTRDILCPNCYGGNTKEKSFSIQREDGKILYKCWRITCGIKGVLNDNGSLVESFNPSDRVQTTAGRRYTKALGPMTLKGYQLFWDKYGMVKDDFKEAGVSYAMEEDRYAFPVHNSVYQGRGLSLRSFDQSKFPKWDHYQNFEGPANPWIGWYLRVLPNPTSKQVIVVEDPISALKISRQYRSCYLNGTNLSLEKLLEISKVAGQHGIVFALDKDASAKAIELAHRYKFFIGDKVVCTQLPEDAKYLTDAAIKDLFEPASVSSRDAGDLQVI